MLLWRLIGRSMMRLEGCAFHVEAIITRDQSLVARSSISSDPTLLTSQEYNVIKDLRADVYLLRAVFEGQRQRREWT